MATATKTRSGVASWKKLLVEAEQLRGQSGISAHRRAKILTSLFHDEDFKAERGLDDETIVVVLDELVEDLCLTFRELYAMLREFPSVEQWSDGKLASLYESAMEQVKARRAASSEELQPITRRRVTSKEYDRLAGEKQDLEARLNYVSKQHSEAVSEIERLKMENAELKGRISELEKMVAKRA